MAYINTDTLQHPVSEQDIRALHPNTSFPEPFTAPAPFAWVFPAPQPSYDPIAQTVRETTPTITAKGHWEQQWEVVDLPAEAIAANQAAANEQRRASIKAQIAALDLRRIRPLAEGDTEYLATLNAQIAELRSQL